MSRQNSIARLETFPARFRDLVTPLSPEDLAKRLPGEWSVLQIIHHVADSHINAMLRFKKPLTEDRPNLPNYDQDAFALLGDYDAPISWTLQILEGIHARLVRLLESLSEEQWQRTGLHPSWGEVTVEELAQRYADHGDNHIEQIQRTLANA
ncbi:MAG: DinB family protein [Anaerolineae bacterium]|jgi:hypothetical protein|nr:DinB family protein [Anaerolineae bacterium]